MLYVTATKAISLQFVIFEVDIFEMKRVRKNSFITAVLLVHLIIVKVIGAKSLDIYYCTNELF